jgi:hypothetical protein
MERRKMSNNFRVLRNIMSKTRQTDISEDMSYLLIYAFLYKYCSDIQKDHFLSLIRNREMTLDDAFKDEACQSKFRSDAFEMFGFYIPSPDMFLDELIFKKYSERFFMHEFISSFSEGVEFPPNSRYEAYFKFIFDSIKNVININKFEFEGESHLVVKDLVYTISKLDVFEEGFPFERVFDRVCDSKLIRAKSDPYYINSILSAITISQKIYLDDVYNPFLNDASSLIDLAENYSSGIKHVHARGYDRISYCASIVKFFLNFNLNDVFLNFESPYESVDMAGARFDAIISRIPPITARRYNQFKSVQSEKIAKRKREMQLRSVLSDQFGFSEEDLENDPEIKNTIENLASRMNVKDMAESDFEGEYKALKDSEYLFLINLINSLKDDGIMAVSLSQGFLTKKSLETLRKYLTVKKNCIDCVITVPNEISRPRRPDVIVVFRKNKSTDDIVFIDLSEDYDVGKTRYPVSGTFKRNLTLGRKTIDKIVEVYNARQTIDKFSNVVSLRELAKNDFILSTSRYVDTFGGEFIRLEDLKDQKQKTDCRIRRLNKKINMMMDDLGIDF